MYYIKEFESFQIIPSYEEDNFISEWNDWQWKDYQEGSDFSKRRIKIFNDYIHCDWALDKDELWISNYNREGENQLKWLQLILKKLKELNYEINGRIFWEIDGTDYLLIIKNYEFRLLSFHEIVNSISFEQCDMLEDLKI